jgi:hypothetical protein
MNFEQFDAAHPVASQVLVTIFLIAVVCLGNWLDGPMVA